jgi:iron complex transport system substrate-binding protein
MTDKLVLVAASFLAFVICFSVREEYFRGADRAATESRSYKRIISIAPSVTETLCALGLEDRLVGVSRFCKYPPKVTELPKVGGFFDPNFEAIVALKPDLVVMLQEHERCVPGYQKLGLKTVVLCHKTVEGIIESITTLGRLCGVEDRAEQITDDIQSRLKRIREKTAGGKRPKVMIAIDRVQGSGGLIDVYIAGADGFFDKIIELAGGKNVYQGKTVSFPVVSAEGIMRLNPDVIIDLVSGLDTSETRRQQKLAANKDGSILSDWEGLADVEAVKNHRVYAFDRDYATVPGPRFILFVEDLAEVLHP